MALTFSKIKYTDLNPRQQEKHNYHKLSAILADYGFDTMWLTDDWKGADFIAQHIDGQMMLKVQLKGRLTFSKKYSNKSLYIAFYSAGDWYFYPHDELLERIIAETNIAQTLSWTDGGMYSFPSLSKQLTNTVSV